MTKPKARGGLPLEQVYVPDRDAWHRWLTANHASSKGIWLIYDKKTSRPDRLRYADAVEEALCFGWIDSTLRPLDAARYMQLFTPRKAKSSWSKLNKARVAKLVAENRMHPAGEAVVAEAKRTGTWSRIDAVESLTMPADLRKALSAKKALANFNAFPPSARKGYLHWIHTAKRPETRARRIATVVTAAVTRTKFRQDLASNKRST